MEADRALAVVESAVSKLDAVSNGALLARLKWLKVGRSNQIIPETDDWTTCGVMAGRGFGKTMMGAAWAWWQAWRFPKSYGAIVAPTRYDAQSVCIEGPAGILKQAPENIILSYNKSELKITLVNGSTIQGFSASEPDRLRGPQHHWAWCFAADTLILMSDGSQKKIVDVVKGDMVATRHGPRRVMAAAMSDNPGERVRIRFGKTSLTGTVDHPILVGDRWVPMGELKAGDLLWQVSDMMEYRGGSDRTGILSAVNRAGICTGLFMKRLTEKFQGRLLSITKTVTIKITTFQTLLQWNGGSTAPTTIKVRKCLTAGSSLRLKQCWPHGERLQTKIQHAFAAVRNLHQKLLAGQESFVPAHAWKYGGQTSLSLNSGNAAIAKWNIPPQNQRQNIVPKNATLKATVQIIINKLKQLTASIASSNLKQNGAMGTFASENVRLNTIKIQNVERLNHLLPVYNLTVEGEHEFIANGVIVHNCDELAAWEDPETVWDMLQFGMRLGERPQTIWTTTPRPIPLVRKLIVAQSSLLIRGSTYDNKDNLPKSFFESVEQYRGTKIGRQELLGELLDAEEGGVIKREWINLWPRSRPVPPFQEIMVSFDTAFTEKTRNKKSGDPDPTACAVWGWFDHDGEMGFMLLDCWQDHLGFPELVEKAKKEMSVRWGDDEFRSEIKPKFGSNKPYNMGRKPDHMIIEDKGSGISLRQVLYREGIFPIAYNPGNASKLQRLHAVSHLFHGGLVYIVESKKHPGEPAAWASELINQICSFQGEGSIRHDDFVDATTQALRWMADNARVSVTEEDRDDNRTPMKEVVNPYAQ